MFKLFDFFYSVIVYLFSYNSIKKINKWLSLLKSLNIKKYFFIIKDFFNYFSKKYLYTINHKQIALNYFYLCIITGLSGLSLATMIRIELATPGSHFFKGDSIKYLQVITAHGLIMVFFVVSPLLFGFLANFFVPYHVGSKDVAFPRINSFGFWIFFCGYILLLKMAFYRKQMFNYYDASTNMLVNFLNKKIKKINKFKNLNYLKNLPIEKKKNQFFSNLSSYNFDFLSNFFYKKNITKTNSNYWYFFVNTLVNEKKKYTYVVQSNDSGSTTAGWTFITPFTSKLKYIGFGAQDIAIIGVIFTGVTTTLSFVNLLITRRTLSMPGLKNKKSLIPFLSITLFLTLRMLALITPVLGGAMMMLEFDRHWSTSFFDHTYGGDSILFHHLFWFFGHPEVYVVIIPCFGIINMLLPFNNFRRIASKNHLIWATYIMAYMGFLVWGHHMYLIGLDHKARSFYSTITIMISLPAVVKIVNWTLTMLNGHMHVDSALLFGFSFITFFLSGGLTGMWLSHVGLNIFVHDTFYVVAHFHMMFSASTFSAIFCSIYFYFYQIFFLKYSKLFSYFHWVYWTIGQWVTFIPLYYVGYNGLPRRYHDYPSMYSSWHGISSFGHIFSIFSIFFFFFVLFEAKYLNKKFSNLTFFIPRFSKRVLFYFYKMAYYFYARFYLLVNSNISNLIFKF